MAAADGLYRFARELRAGADDLPRRASQVVRKAALDTQADAQAIVPVDTGMLKNSIIAVARPGALTAGVVATASYAGFVEFGTSRMAAQPFMRPAADRNAPGFAQALAQLANPGGS